jgi:hypothetical protein
LRHPSGSVASISVSVYEGSREQSNGAHQIGEAVMQKNFAQRAQCPAAAADILREWTVRQGRRVATVK